MESSSKIFSNIYPGLHNMNQVALEVLLPTMSSLHGYRHRKIILLFDTREAGHIHCDIVGNTILY